MAADLHLQRPVRRNRYRAGSCGYFLLRCSPPAAHRTWSPPGCAGRWRRRRQACRPRMRRCPARSLPWGRPANSHQQSVSHHQNFNFFGSIFFLLSVKSRQLLTDLRSAAAPLEGRCLLPATLQVSGGPFQTAGPERPRGKDNALEETSLRRQCREVQSPPEAAVAATLPLPSLWSRLLLNGLQYPTPGWSTANFG